MFGYRVAIVLFLSYLLRLTILCGPLSLRRLVVVVLGRGLGRDPIVPAYALLGFFLLLGRL